jgi:hypothetical protein
MKLRLFFLVLCLTAPGFEIYASISPGKANLLASVPSNSVVVARIKWKDVREDSRLTRFIFADEVQNKFRSFSIDSDDVTEFVLFSDARNLNDPDVGFIVRGSYNVRDIVSRLAERGWTENVERGYKLYSDAANRSHLTVLKSRLLAFGTKSAVEDAISVEVSPQNSLASVRGLASLTARFGRRTQSISAMVALPKAYQDAGNVALKVISVALQFSGLDLIAQVLETIGLAQAIGCSISRSRNHYPVELVAIMKDQSAAGFVSRGLKLLKEALLLITPSKDRETMQVLQSMSVKTQGATLSVRITM